MTSATTIHPGQQVIHVDMGEVTVTEVSGEEVTVADEFNDTVRVPVDEIC